MTARIVELQAADYEGLRDSSGFEACRLQAERADRHFAAVDEHASIRARCSVWWRETASADGRMTGAIGHYAAEDAACGAAVLGQALRELANRGCELAVGPLDGCTWRRYRFITERGTARPFFLEPDNPDDWPRHFGACGFAPLARYVSELNTDIATRQPDPGSLPRQFASLGVTIGPIDAERPDDDLAGIYRVVCESFRDAFLYSPLDFAAYAALYVPLLRQVDPRLMLVARHAGEVVGFILGPPDLLQRQYRPSIDTIVLKTVAVLPRRIYRGLGRVLIVQLLRNAIDAGYTAAISALMHVGNRSREISSRCAGPMRTYTLFAKELSS